MRDTMHRFFILLISFIALISSARAENELRILTEDFAPYGYTENEQLTGVGPDIIRAMSKVLDISNFKIEILPWKRAYKQTIEEKNVALFSMTFLPQRKGSFKWVGPLYSMQEYLFARKESPLIIANIEDARKIKSILVQDGGASEASLRALGFDNLEAMNNMDKRMTMLMNGRVEVISATGAEVVFQMRSEGFRLNSVKPVLELDKRDLYLAFSLHTDDKIVEKWRDALNTIHENGTWHQITQQYMPDFKSW